VSLEMGELGVLCCVAVLGPDGGQVQGWAYDRVDFLGKIKPVIFSLKGFRKKYIINFHSGFVSKMFFLPVDSQG